LQIKIPIYPFTPRVSYGDVEVTLTSESVDEILWCDHSNETSSAVLLHDTVYISVFYNFTILGTLGRERVNNNNLLPLKPSVPVEEFM